MKKLITLPVVLGLLISGCAVQKHCFINPPLDREYTVTAGGVLVEKVECHGRATVDDCRTALRLTYFAKTEGKIRIQGSVGMVWRPKSPAAANAASRTPPSMRKFMAKVARKARRSSPRRLR